MVVYYITTGILLCLICGVIWAWKNDIKNWNGGKCSCGGSWESFDTDSQGGRGYACRKCNERYIWISYPRVENNVYETTI